MKKFIVSVFLVISIFVSSVIPSYAVVDPISAIGLGLTAVQVLQTYLDESASSAEKAAALQGYKDHWISSLPGDSSSYTDVSYNALSNALIELSNSAQPAKIVYSSFAGGYVIQASGPFGYHSYSGSSGFGANYVWNNTGYYLTNTQRVVFRAKYDTDTFIGYISDKLTTVISNLGTISGTLTDKLTSMESSLTRLLSRTLKTDQDGTQYTLAELVYNLWQKVDRLYDRTLKTVGSSQYTISDLQYNTWQQTERAASRLLKTVDNAQYTVADLQYNTWQQAKNAVIKLGSIDTRLSTLHTDATGLAGRLDNIADLLSATTYTCGYKTNASGTAYPTQAIPYNMAVQIAARINSEMLGKQMYCIWLMQVLTMAAGPTTP